MINDVEYCTVLSRTLSWYTNVIFLASNDVTLYCFYQDQYEEYDEEQLKLLDEEIVKHEKNVKELQSSYQSLEEGYSTVTMFIIPFTNVVLKLNLGTLVNDH